MRLRKSFVCLTALCAVKQTLDFDKSRDVDEHARERRTCSLTIHLDVGARSSCVHALDLALVQPYVRCRRAILARKLSPKRLASYMRRVYEEVPGWCRNVRGGVDRVQRHKDVGDHVALTHGTRSGRNDSCSSHRFPTRSGRDNAGPCGHHLACSRRDNTGPGRDSTGPCDHQPCSHPPDRCLNLHASAGCDTTSPSHHVHWPVPCLRTFSVMAHSSWRDRGRCSGGSAQAAMLTNRTLTRSGVKP